MSRFNSDQFKPKYKEMKNALFLIFFLSISLYSYSQDFQSFQKNYENGKELFKIQRYGLAMQAFKPLTSAFNDNPFLKHANYYYGVSAYYEGQIEIAIGSFNYLKDNYPNWDQIDEVKLWLEKCYLAKFQYENAIRILNEIQATESKKYGSELLLSQLNKITSYDSVFNLYSKYPDNEAIAITMANAISKQPFLEQDRDLLFTIVDKFHLDVEKYRIIDQSTSTKKSSYTVAVLLPFMIKDLEKNRGMVRNQFVIDIYQGLLLGVKELKSLGIKLNISTYDTESRESKVRQILSKPELQHVDLIYGPLYPDPVNLTNQFSFDYKINMFNPLSNNSRVIGNNPYSFLYHPTYETLSEKSAEFALKKTKNRNGYVIFGREQKDSLMANTFIQTMYKAGDSAITTISVEENNSKKIIQILTEGTEVELEVDQEEKVNTVRLYKIAKDSIGYIYVASEDSPYAASVITAMETREDTTLLIGNESWLNSQIINYEALERLDAYIFAPTYLNKESPSYRYFESKYREKYNCLPSTYACIGYETVILLGKLMNKYGDHFQNEFTNQSMEGLLFGKYILNNRNDNQHIPIVKFEDSELLLYKPNKK